MVFVFATHSRKFGTKFPKNFETAEFFQPRITRIKRIWNRDLLTWIIRSRSLVCARNTGRDAKSGGINTNCTNFHQWVHPVCENSCNSCLKFFGARRITRLGYTASAFTQGSGGTRRRGRRALMRRMFATNFDDRCKKTTKPVALY